VHPVCYIRNLSQQAFHIVSRQGVAWLECRRLSRLSWVLHAFSMRCSGLRGESSDGFNLGFTTSDQRARVSENRRLFFAQLSAEHFALASLRQIHSSHIYQVVWGRKDNLQYHPGAIPHQEQPAAPRPAGDALLTDEPGILLSVTTADCLPVFLVDTKRRAVAAIHSGWRGALARVIEKTAGEMRRIFHSRPETLLAVLGPSIRASCYEVGEEVVEAFQGHFAGAEKFFLRSRRASKEQRERGGHAFPALQPPGLAPHAPTATRLDLVAVARDQLLSAGLLPRRIAVADFCTACRTDLFFSYRKEGRWTGRTMAVIGIRPSHPR
jgi:YfiH family protein